MSNYIKFYIRNALYYVAVIFSSGTVMQSFLKTVGVTDKNIGLFTSAMLIAQMVTILCASGASDKVKNIKKALTIAFFPMSVMLLALSPLCFFIKEISPKEIFILALTLGCLQSVFIGVRTVLEYKLPYHIIDMNKYPTLVSVDGIVSGCVGIGVSLLFSAAVTVFDYYTVVGICFGAGGIMFIAVSLINNSFKTDRGFVPDEKPEKAKGGLWEMIKDKSFYVLIIPNIFRGLSNGVVGVLSLIGFDQAGITEKSSSMLVIASTAGSVIGGIIYIACSKHIAAHKVCFAAGIGTAVSYALLCVSRQPLVFCVGFFLVQMFVICINCSIPIMIMHIVPYRMIGSYTALRMMLTTGGTALGSALLGMLLGKIPTSVILLSAAAFQFISGLVYMIYTNYSVRTGRSL